MLGINLDTKKVKKNLKEIVIDLDDYFKQLFEIQNVNIEKLIFKYRFESNNTWPLFMELTESYYYLIRNSFILIPTSNSNEEELRSIEQDLFKIYVGWAYYLADKQIRDNQPAKPGWIEFIFKDIEKYSDNKELVKIIKTIKINILHIYSQIVIAEDNYSISISSIFKPLFLNYNLFLFLLMVRANKENFDKEVFISFFPYYLHSLFNIKPTRLPRSRVFDRELYRFAQRLSNYQLLFLVLHELAHIQLEHFGKNSSLPDFEKEVQADIFAANTLFKWPESGIQDIYISIEILYSFYMTLVFSANTVLPIVRENYKERKNTFFERYKNILQISGPQKPSDETRTLISKVRNIFAIYRDYLSSIDPNELQTMVNLYNKGDSPQVFTESKVFLNKSFGGLF